MNIYQFNSVYKVALDIIASAWSLQGIYPFPYSLIENIFQKNNRYLSTNLEWVFSGNNSESMINRMILLLKSEGVSFNSIPTDDEKRSYAVAVVDRLKDYYNV